MIRAKLPLERIYRKVRKEILKESRYKDSAMTNHQLLLIKNKWWLVIAES